MIGEIRAGASFQGLQHYLLHGSRETAGRTPAWSELRNLATQDPERAAREMAATAAEAPRVRSPVYHVILSPAPEDHLSRKQWSALADRVLVELGLEEHQVLGVLHTDTGVPHLHLAINRVHPETHRAWGTWRSKTRLEMALRQIEVEWGLRRVPGRLATAERAVRGELAPAVERTVRAQARHRAGEPQLLAWRRSLAGDLREARSWNDLAARLDRRGLALEARGRGLVVTDGTVYVKASSLDRSVSRGRLEARFGRPFAAFREDLRHFDAAARSFGRYDLLDPDHIRARAARETLRAIGRRLGWQDLERLRRPLGPSVGAVALAERRREHLARAAGGRPVWEVLLERHVTPALERSGSWAEAEARLRVHGVWIARRPEVRGLVVTDGDQVAPVATLGRGLEPAALEGRLGPWAAWRGSRRALLRAASRIRRVEARAPADQVRHLRLAGLLQMIQLRVEGYRTLHAQLQEVEGRLRDLLVRELPGSARRERELAGHLRGLLGRRGDEVLPYLEGLRSGWAQRLGLPGRRPSEELVATAMTYRRLAFEVARQAGPARSAARRLPRLRLAARRIDPRGAQLEARRALLRVARPLLRTGVRSLLARALPPGLGLTLSIFRSLTRGARELLRDHGMER